MTRTFKSDGVLWRLATVYGPLDARFTRKWGTDICTYTQAVIKGIFAVLAITALGSFAAIAVGEAGAFWAASLVLGTIPPEGAPFIVMLGSTLILMAAVTGIVFFAIKTLKRLNAVFKLKKPSTPPVVISKLNLMIDAWKNKYCCTIDFRSDNAS